MKRLLALLIVLFPFSALAVQDTCTFTGNVTWSATGTTSGGSVSCTGGDSTLGGDDIIVISSGTTTITGNIVGTSAANAGITVNSGATLNVSVSAVTPTAIKVTLGPAGLNCALGSTCTFAGRYRSWGVTPATTYSDPQTAAGSYFQFGDPWPCATSTVAGCTAGAKYKVDYSITNEFGRSSGGTWDKYVGTSLTAITASSDYICFFDPSGGTADYIGADVNNCYEVTTGGSATSFQFDPRQGSVDENGYPLARRDVPAKTTLNAQNKGDTTITVSGHLSPDLITRNTVLRGRWLRFQPAANSGLAADSRPYKILKTTRGGTNDTITIGDTRGFQRAIASGEDIYIDYGWETGDPFFVLVPVVFTTATVAADKDSRVKLRGTVSINGVVFRDTCELMIGPDPSGGICTGDSADADRTQPTINAFKNVIAWDMRNASAEVQFGDADNFEVSGLNTVGGSTINSDDVAYGFLTNGSNIYIHDASRRYGGDDCFTGLETGTYARTQLNNRFSRIHCGPAGDNADSGNFYDASPNSASNPSQVMEALITDAMCDDCTTRDGMAVLGIDDNGQASTQVHVTINNIMDWGSICGLGSVAMSHAGSYVQVNNAEILGIQHDVSPGYTTTSMKPCNVATVPYSINGFVVRDAVLNDNSAGGNATIIAQNTGKTNTIANIQNGYFYNVDQVNSAQGQIGLAPNQGTISNVAFIDLKQSNKAAAGNAIYSTGTVANFQTWKNILFAQTPALSGYAAKINRMIYTDAVKSGSDASTVTFSNIAAYNLVSTGMVDVMSGGYGTQTWTGNQCFFNVPGAINANLINGQITEVLDQPPMLNDAQFVNYASAKGGLWGSYGCGTLTGAQAPGVHRYLWMHKISKILPETLGVPTLTGGGGASAPVSY